MIINELLVEIAKDMMTLLKTEPSLESLRSMRFDLESPPDYENPLSQMLYLLRYYYAYSYEYYLAFRDMIDFVDGDIKVKNFVLSIGCGAAFDYWALKRAVNYDDLDGYDEVFNYTGVDKVSWLYPCSKEGNDSLTICKKDFISWLRDNPSVFAISDIIIFPKSIGEFSDEYFSEMLSEIKKDECKITRKSVVVIGSFRRSKHEFDEKRFDQFVAHLKSSANYKASNPKSNDRREQYYPPIPEDNKYFFGYPKNVNNAMYRLYERCNKYKHNGNQHCPDCKCEESLVFKSPITTLKYVDYKIVILKRDQLLNVKRINKRS